MSSNTCAKRSRRPRGGQPGNQNARTHGYYSKTLTPSQHKALQSASHLQGTDREIAVLCLRISSILSSDPGNCRVLGRALASLTRLLTATLQPDGTLRYPEALQAILTMQARRP